MARRRGSRKKEKIRVELDLPKSDKTRSIFWAITITGSVIGVLCLGFWAMNTDLIFQPANGNPLFVNKYCSISGAQGFDSNLPPDYADNESCWLTKERPLTQTWVVDWPGLKPPGMGQEFEVPGMDPNRLGTLSHPETELRMSCNAVAAESYAFSVTIWEPDDLGQPQNPFKVQSVTNWEPTESDPENPCTIVIPDAKTAPGWEVHVQYDRGLPNMKSFTMIIEVDSYDGVPNYMNNASFFLGPEVEVGPLKLRPFLFVNFFGYGFLLIVFPGAIYWDKKMKTLSALEQKFPDFLRDLAEFWKGGLSMTLAVRTLATSEYGALNYEVRKMSDQLSWDVAFEDVLDMFADRVGTPLVTRAISLIHEANKAGGKISDILVTAANDSREIKFLELERIRAIASYIAVIWTSFFVFLGVIVVLSKVFIPAISSSNSGEESAQIGNMVIRAIDPLFFLVVFFYGVSAQAVGNGIMAGLMATGRLSSGCKHAGLMLICSILAFNVICFTPDLIGVPLDDGLNPGLAPFIVT